MRLLMKITTRLVRNGPSREPKMQEIHKLGTFESLAEDTEALVKNSRSVQNKRTYHRIDGPGVEKIGLTSNRWAYRRTDEPTIK